MIHKLAAVKLVRDLEMKLAFDSASSEDYADQKSLLKKKALEQEIVAISCQHGS